MLQALCPPISLGEVNVEIKRIKQNYLVVRPLCFFVLSLGYAHVLMPMGACAPLRATFVYFNHLRG